MNERLRRLQKKIEESALEALLISHPANRYYLSGFNGTSGYLLIGRQDACLITDFRYREQAAKQSPHFEIHDWKETLPQSLAPLLGQAGWRRIGFEKKHLTYALYQELAQGLSAELEPVEGFAEDMRLVKDEAELAILRHGASCMDQAFSHILNYIRPGLSEQEVALELEFFLRRLGAAEASFKYIVASGERGAMPHGVASSKTLSLGELVTMDFGAVFDAYATDMTRTICLGEPEQRGREVYEIVRRAHQRAVQDIRPGMTGREADALARSVIDEAGYGDRFGHGLGHGVGLEIHELPVLSPRGEAVLVPGMIATVEPGIYIPGWGGIRIEDMVLITGRGASLLTHSSRELIIV